MNIRGAAWCLALALAAAVGSSALPANAAEDCRVVRGRMEATNGTPGVRIWIVGTKRILGVTQQATTYKELPANIRRAWEVNGSPEGHWLYGDFKVCALTPERPGWMQMVRVERGTNLRRD